MLGSGNLGNYETKQKKNDINYFYMFLKAEYGEREGIDSCE